MPKEKPKARSLAAFGAVIRDKFRGFFGRKPKQATTNGEWPSFISTTIC